MLHVENTDTLSDMFSISVRCLVVNVHMNPRLRYSYLIVSCMTSKVNSLAGFAGYNVWAMVDCTVVSLPLLIYPYTRWFGCITVKSHGRHITWLPPTWLLVQQLVQAHSTNKSRITNRFPSRTQVTQIVVLCCEINALFANMQQGIYLPKFTWMFAVE